MLTRSIWKMKYFLPTKRRKYLLNNNNREEMSIVVDVYAFGEINDFRLEEQKFKPTENLRHLFFPLPHHWSSRANKWTGPDRIFKRLADQIPTSPPQTACVYKTSRVRGKLRPDKGWMKKIHLIRCQPIDQLFLFFVPLYFLIICRRTTGDSSNKKQIYIYIYHYILFFYTSISV